MEATTAVETPRPLCTMQSISKYRLKMAFGQGITGLLCIVFQMVLNAVQSRLHYIGQGTWAGLFFMLTGAIGVLSLKRNTMRLTVAFFVLAIISAVLTAVVILISSYDIWWGWGFAANGFNVLMILAALVEAALSIASSALICHGSCGVLLNQPMMIAGQVRYVELDGQQQLVIVPMNQDGTGLPAGTSFNPTQTEPPEYNQTPLTTDESEQKLPIPE